MNKKYKITNYGNTRSIYVKGQTWEITKGATIEILTADVENASEVAAAFDELMFVDVVVENIGQPDVKPSSKQKKTSKKKLPSHKKRTLKKKKKVTTRKHKKIKRRKVKRRNK